jgi:aryl-alcohol dehydrogenase-like predicted oxidoreductase
MIVDEVFVDGGKPMQQRALGRSGLDVGAIGLGCMGFSIAYDPGTKDDAESVHVIRRALDLGVTLLDTSDAYGPFVNEALVGRAIADRRDDAVIATKAGCAPNTESFVPKPDGRPEVLRACCDASLRRLGVDVIDLWQLHRADPMVPIEESVGAMSEMVDAGKVRAIGVSEVSLVQLQAAQRTFPIATLQSELSLWTRDSLTEIVPWCVANDIAFVAFAPLGRGYLTGTIDADRSFGDKDVRAMNPRFTSDARRRNRPIVDGMRTVAARHHASLAQVALAWVLAQGDHVVAIPGSDQLRFLHENVAAADLSLTPADLAELDALPAAVGERY